MLLPSVLGSHVPSRRLTCRILHLHCPRYVHRMNSWRLNICITGAWSGGPLYTLTWGVFPSDVLTMHVITTCVCIVKPYNEALLWRLIEVTVFSPWQKRDEKALMIKKLREKKERVRWRRFDLFCFPNSFKNISPESVLCQRSADIPT